MTATEEEKNVNGVDGDELVLRVDGTEPLSLAAVRAVEAVCARADALGAAGGTGVLPVLLSGAPAGSWTADADVALVTKWERALRRLERVGMTTIATATGDVGGLALDVLLTTDLRIVTPDTRLLVAVGDGATWPGMAAYRLTVQAGVAPVRRAVLFGHPIAAAEARAMGLVHEVEEDTAKALIVATEAAAELSGRELAIRRQLMHEAAHTSFENALGAHLAACDRALRQAPARAAS
ncbi:enoyl-CoA-hydratase DpgB [Sphaerisporangium sp. B11E5]|uniref:enoyl-CoA-hydratase DpgB n=1 Tax=Sphaerisporangium sp. B11E5 TaxID=3153563 RepID=UPI00325C3AF5